MSYKWDKFNIKTIESETIVYCDGYFVRELSKLDKTDVISKKYDKPVHIIYVGQISGENTLNINLDTNNQPVFLSVNIENKFPAFLNIFIKNAGKNSEIRGHILLKNKSDLSVKIIGEHNAPNTAILLQTKIIGFKKSFSRISGTVIINKNCENTVSDICFSGHCVDKTAKIRFIPAQKIQSVPKTAEHSAYMFNINKEQENYLRTSGLSYTEIKNVEIESFINDFNLF